MRGALLVAILALLAAGAGLHLRVVRPALRRHGEPVRPSVRPSALMEQIRAYGRLCRERGVGLGPYRLLTALPWALAALVLAWLASGADR